MEHLEKSLTAYPLSLFVVENGVGVTGLSCTVALRNATTTDSYLDFSDGTFKTSGWTLQFAPLTEIGTGRYHRLLNAFTTTGLVEGMILAAEYSDGTNATMELLQVTKLQAQVTLLRKVHTNRVVETPGDPGAAVVFDDDDATPVLTYATSDSDGDAVTSPSGSPARRTKATGTY